MNKSKNQLKSFEKWEFVKELGSGGFGKVCVWKNCQTNNLIATKLLKSNNALLADQIKKLHERWKQEYEWTRDNMDTKYIVNGIRINDDRFLEYLHQHQGWPEMPVITMEYCNGGDLRTHLQKPENLNGLSELEVREIMKSLRHAIQYLHEKCNIEHRDLKPDNIVMHDDDGKRFYKLIDFGLARQIITKDTLLQSFVGTRNYFAPEILTGKYKKSVDYWSFGVIAFELMCGVLPFIPHESIPTIFQNVKLKKRECIAITENRVNSTGFTFHTQIFKENHLSKIFVEKIENWLTMALDTDYKTRGYSPAQIKSDGRPIENITPALYTELDQILSTKILKVFCLNTNEFYFYEIKPSLSMNELMKMFECDIGKKVEIIFPTQHPCKEFTYKTKPIELYVEEWLDTNDASNPPAMLYLMDQCDYNDKERETMVPPLVSKVITDSIKLPEDVVKTLPGWYVHQFALHTHFLISIEQRRLQAIMSGMEQNFLKLGHLIFYFNINVVSTQALVMFGNLMQFNTMVQAAENANALQLSHCANFFHNYKQMGIKIEEYYKKISNITTNLIVRYNSVARRIKKEETNDYYKKMITDDIYELQEFRKKLMMSSRNELSVKNVFLETENAFKTCLQKRGNLLSDKNIQLAKITLAELKTEFTKINKLCDDTISYINKQITDIGNATKDFQQQLSALHQNGYNENNSKSVFFHDSSNHELSSTKEGSLLSLDTNDLIHNLNTTMELFSLEIPENMDFPTTLDEVSS